MCKFPALVLNVWKHRHRSYEVALLRCWIRQYKHETILRAWADKGLHCILCKGMQCSRQDMECKSTWSVDGVTAEQVGNQFGKLCEKHQITFTRCRACSISILDHLNIHKIHQNQRGKAITILQLVKIQRSVVYCTDLDLQTWVFVNKSCY